MALVLADRVRDTTTTTGTGTVTLSGTAPTGYQNFSVVGNGNTTYYTINAGSQWEVGIGTYSSTGPTLARTTILASSSAGAAVDFAAGTKDVFVTYPSGESVYQDGTAIAAGTSILGVTNGGTGTNTTFTSGSVVFAGASGVYSQDNASLFWDDSNNRLGIGNTTPGYKLEVTGDIRLGSGGDLRLGSATGTTGSAGDSQIYNDANNMIFSTGTTTAERMRIDSSGNVGIGNTGPTYRLDVSSADTTAGLGYAMRIRANATAAGGAFQFTDSGATAQWGFLAATATAVTLDCSTAGSLVFRTNNSERARISSGGFFGIGTSSPQVGLHVSFADQSTNRIRLQNTGASGGTFDIIGGLAGASNVGLSFYDVTNAATRMYIDSSGQVGIGTSSLSAGYGSGKSLMLTNQSSVLFQNASNAWSTSSTGGAITYFNDNNLYLDAKDSASNMIFRVNGATERMRIDSSGNVGIGTTTPTYKLEVKGSPSWFRNFAGTPASPTEVQDWPVSALNIASYGDFTLQTMLAFTLPNDGNYDTGYSTWNFKLDQTASSTTSAGVTGMQFGGPGYLAFMPGGTEKARITSGGEVYIAGTTDQGAYNLQCNGTGVWGAGAYVNGSDRNLKEDIAPLADALGVVAALNPVTFRYKEEYSKDQSTQPGFIAQELQEALSGQVYLDGVVQAGPKHLNVAYQALVPILVKAIQELTVRVAQLEGN